MHRHAHWATVALAAFVLAACSGSNGSDLGGGPTAPPPPPAPVQTNTIKLFTSGGNRFEPANIEVPVGTTVTFVWEDGFHDVTSAGSPSFQGGGNPVSPPKSFPVTFTKAGTYTFFCSVHGSATSGMHGTITVR
ncbi:MAG: cupredoxin domain-containing protein [Gemmatimonadales bacterium]